MSGMVERAARAAYENWIENVRDLEPRWDDLPESHKHRLIECQRAALKAMREPTRAMCAAADACEAEDWRDKGEREPGEIHWRAMIDAALKE